MRTPSFVRNRSLIAAASALGLLAGVAVSYQLQAATNPNHNINLTCDTPVGAVSQDVEFSVSGPDTAAPGAAIELTMDPSDFTVPAVVGPANVEAFKNIRITVAVAGASIDAAAITQAGTHGGSVAVSGSNVTLTIPGPVAAGATMTSPEVTIDATVSAADGGSILVAPGSPFYLLDADTNLADVIDIACEPTDGTQTANATLTVPVEAAATTTTTLPDTEGPSITIAEPYEGAIYGFEEEVLADYACTDPSDVDTCVGPVAVGAAIDTSAAGVYDFTVTATDSEGNASEETVEYAVLPPGEAPPARPNYEAIVPARLLDTRSEFSTIDGEFHKLGKQGNGSTLELQVTGRDGAAVPDDAVSVVLNVTATETEGPGHVTVYPCDADLPNASNLNYIEVNDNRPNAVVSKLDDSGQVCLYAYGAATHLVVDVSGYFPPGARFTALTPGRLLDTRAEGLTVDGNGQGDGPVEPGSPIEVPVGDRHGVPAGASAAVLNVTAVNTGGAGFLTVFPCDQDKPWASNVNFVTTGEITPNLVVSKLSADGSICLDAGVSPTDVVVDLIGFFPAVADYVALNPGRLLDTRSGGDTVDGDGSGAGKPPVGERVVLQVADRHGIPADAAAAVLNVTITEPDAPGYVTAWPCDVDQPNASNLNYVREGQNRPNVVVSKLSADGTVCLVAEPASTHIVVDVAGYFPAPEEPTEPTPTTTTTTTVPGATTTTTTPTPGPTPTPNPGTTTTTTTIPASEPEAPSACAAFLTQAAAQALYDFLAALGQESLLDGLDPNGNGIVCEDYEFPL